MATAERVLALKLIGDVSDINRGLNKTNSQFKKMSSQAAKWGKAFAGALIIDGIDKVTDSLAGAWAGFRSGEKVAAQLGNTWKRLGLDSSKLASTLDQVTASTLKLGTSDDEAVQAFNNSLLRTRDYSESLRQLKIAQDLVANGSAPNLEAAFNIIRQAAKGSSRFVDKFGLTADTASGRVTQLGHAVAGAAKIAANKDPFRVFTNRIGEGWEAFIGSLATGNFEGSLAALRGIGKAITDALFGVEKSYRIGKKGQGIKITARVGGIADQIAKVGTMLVDGIRKAIDDAVGTIDFAKVLSFDGLVSALNVAIFALKDNAGTLATIAVVGGALGLAFSGVMFTASVLMAALSTALSVPTWVASSAIHGALQAVGWALGPVFAAAVFAEKSIMAALQSAFGGLTGLKGWVTLTDTVKSIGSKIGTALQIGIVAGITFGIVLALQEALQWALKQAFPGWLNDLIFPKGGLPGAGNRGAGTQSVPNRYTPKQFTQAYGTSQAQAMARGNSYNIIVNVAPGANLVDTGSAIVKAIQAFEKRGGSHWRTA